MSHETTTDAQFRPAALSWRRWLRQSMAPVIAGLAITLLALGLTIGQTMMAQREARTRVMHEGNALLAIHEIRGAMLDAETGQRGFLLIGKTGYLGPYVDAHARIQAGLASLARLKTQTGDERLDGHIQRLEALVSTKFVELDRSVVLARAGFSEQARAIVDSDLGRHEMDAIRAELTALHDERTSERLASFKRAAALENRLIPLMIVLGAAIIALVVAGLRSERNRARAAAEAAQAAALREANEHAQLLARELNHRVKNLFSVILSIITLSGRKQASSREVVDDIRARVRALSLAHATSQGVGVEARAPLGAIVARTLEPYADGAGERVRVSGPEVELPDRMATPLGLIIHELATNAIKYGALSNETGAVEVRWELAPGGDEVSLNWIETGGPALSFDTGTPGHAGFGSQMTDLAARQMGGRCEREWPPGGAVARLRFPLPDPT